MSLEDLAGLAGIPGLEPAVAALFRFYESVENIKVYKEQCKRLHGRCVELLLALRHNDETMYGTDYQNAIDQADLNFERIAKKVHTWSTLGSAKSWVRQSEIKQGIEALNQDLTQCATRLNIMGQMEGYRKTSDIGRAMDQRHKEIEEKLQRLLESTQDIHQILTQPDANIADHMLSIQQAIHEDAARPETIQSLQERLLNIHRKTELLPPMIDLTGEVRRISEHPVDISGGNSDVYLGEWLGREKVALKLTRGINQTPKAQRRFMKEVGIWRKLQHKNIAKLYGVATWGDHIYAVSPWMENRDSLRYITTNPHVDRLKILAEVATGLEFLHRHGVVHGDLRAANILISEAGVACITDFGLSVIVEEEVVDDPTSTSTLELPGSSRWMAPELINPELVGLQVVKRNLTTDIWSYGMLCLEILTGQRPFHNRPHGPAVISDLITGVRPTRPPSEVTQRGLSDAVWGLMQECWHQHPQLRPSMGEIVRRMQAFRSIRENGSLNTTPSPRLPASRLPESPVASGSGTRKTTSILPLRSSPIPIPIRQNNTVLRSESPVSITPPTSSQSTTFTPSPTSPFVVQQSSNGSNVSSTNDFRTSPRIETHSPLHMPNTSHVKSASLDAAPSRGKQPNAGRPSTAPSKADARPPRLPHIGEIHDEATDEGLEDVLAYLRSYRDPSDIPTVRVERSSTPEVPAISTSLPTSLAIPEQQTLYRPVADVAPSEGSEINSTGSELSPTSTNSVDPFVKKPVYIKSRNDGTVEAANLPGLVTRLILDSKDLRMDIQFRETFLTSYQAFTNAETVFGLLLERFDAVSRPPHTAEERASVRYSVITVLDLWLRNHHVETKDVPLLHRMREFTLSIQRPPSAPTLKSSASRLTQLIDSTVNTLMSPIPPLSPSSSSSSVRSATRPSEMTPGALAAALTELESKRFHKIIPSDCVGWLKGIESSNGVSDFITENNKLSYWVQKFILKPDQQFQRTENLKYFLLVAEECRKLRNFSSTCAIFAGLASASITSLKRTSTLSGTNERLFRNLQKLMSQDRNFQAYRQALNASKEPCVPSLHVHLHDLKVVHVAHRTFIRQEGHNDVINFDHYQRLYERIRHTLSYQDPPPRISPSSRHLEIQAFIEGQLRSLIMDEAFHLRLQKRAATLAHQELSNFTSHEDELKAAGFLR